MDTGKYWKNRKKKTKHKLSIERKIELYYNIGRKVNKFLSERMKTIFINGFEVLGITARYEIQNY